MAYWICHSAFLTCYAFLIRRGWVWHRNIRSWFYVRGRMSDDVSRLSTWGDEYAFRTSRLYRCLLSVCHRLRALCRKLSERRWPCDDAKLHQAGCAVFRAVSPGGSIYDAGKRSYYAALPYLRGCLQSLCGRVWQASTRALPAMCTGLSGLCTSVPANGRLRSRY